MLDSSFLVLVLLVLVILLVLILLLLLLLLLLRFHLFRVVTYPPKYWQNVLT